MPTILLALDNKRNSELIKENLEKSYSVIKINGKEDCNKSFDLVIFDLPTFKSLQNECQERIEKEKPLFLPVLLLVKKGTAGAFEQYLGDPVDDIITSPVRKVELRSRIKSLLKTRRFSLRLKEQMKKKSLKDPLTGLYNRRYFENTLNKEAERARRYKHPIAFCMMDINNFKEVNDQYSHMVGDEVLKEISNLLKDNIRESDMLVRYGGDEFMLVMPETNGESKNVVDRIRTKIERWNSETDLIKSPLRIAMGHSHWLPEEEGDIEDALMEADREMYKNKKETKEDSFYSK